LKDTSVEDLLRHLHQVPHDIRTAVRDNGGGHANHSIFWQIIGPPALRGPEGALAEAIKTSFGSFHEFRSQFTKAAMSVFGSGWVWVIDRGDKLVIETNANQDSPLMEGRTPICGLDVWEHA
jgi:Fe-Mn family superoxide dismutase